MLKKHIWISYEYWEGKPRIVGTFDTRKEAREAIHKGQPHLKDLGQVRLRLKAVKKEVPNEAA